METKKASPPSMLIQPLVEPLMSTMNMTARSRSFRRPWVTMSSNTRVGFLNNAAVRAFQRDGGTGVAVTATNYHLGRSTVFFDSHEPIIPCLSFLNRN